MRVVTLIREGLSVTALAAAMALRRDSKSVLPSCGWWALLVVVCACVSVCVCVLWMAEERRA